MDSKARLSPKEKRLIIVNCLNSAAAAFGSYFVAKWTIELDSGLTTLIVQYCIQIIPHMLFYFVGIKLAQKIPVSMVLGFAFLAAVSAYSVFFVLVQTSGTGWANYAFGFMMGIFNGFYWSSTNNISIEATKREGRSRFLTLNSAGNQISSVAAPLIMLVVVLGFKAENSIPFAVYAVFFSILILLYAASAVVAFVMKAQKYDKKLELSKCFFSRGNRSWNYLLLFSMTFGLISGVPAAIGGIYIVAFSKYVSAIYFAYLVGSIVLNCLAGYTFSAMFARLPKTAYYFVCLVLDALTIIAVALTYDLTFALIVVLSSVVFRCFSTVHKTQIENMLHMNIIADNSKENNISGKYLAREVCVMIGRAIMAFLFAAAGLLLKEKTTIILLVGIGYVLINILHGILFLKLRHNLNTQTKETDAICEKQQNIDEIKELT